jgi:hypothetical protein
MRFAASDVVANLALDLETEEYATASGLCASLGKEFGASALEVMRADPQGGWTGFLVYVYMSCPVAEAESAADGLRRAILPAALRYRLDTTFLDFRGDPEAGGFASLWFGELKVDGYTLYDLTAAPGDSKMRRATWVTRPDFTPRDDSDLIYRVHLRVPVADPMRALELYGPLAETIRASFVQVMSARAGGSSGAFSEIALLSALPAVEGETAESGLRRVAAELAAQLGVERQADQHSGLDRESRCRRRRDRGGTAGGAR